MDLTKTPWTKRRWTKTGACIILDISLGLYIVNVWHARAGVIYQDIRNQHKTSRASQAAKLITVVCETPS